MAKKVKKQVSEETKIVCPNCGTEFAIPDKEHVAVGMVVGKDSGLGTIVLQAAHSTNKAAERIAALKNAGVDVSGLFAIKSAAGEDMIAQSNNGVLKILDNSDPIFDAIRTQGDVPNRSLFRRWVVGQMFRLLSSSHGDYTEITHRRGYEYQWKMVQNELYAQMKMYEHSDMNNYAKRYRWFNKKIVVAMAEDYLSKLRKLVKNLPVKKCKGMPYIRLQAKDYFLSDVSNKIFEPIQIRIAQIKNAKTPYELYDAVLAFNKKRIQLPWDTAQSAVWFDAYKGSGAYYTCDNLIRFHKCVAINDEGKKLGKYQSLYLLEEKAEIYCNEGWRLFGFMKKLLEDNKVNISKKLQGWKK